MPGKVERECPVCTTVYEADEGRLRLGRQTTCSRVCSYRLRGQQSERGLAMVCGSCRTEFRRTPSQIKAKHGASFCSPQCQYAGRGLGVTPRVVSRPYRRVAGPPSAEQIARQVAARRAGKGYQHSDDTRDRLREATARRIAEGRIRPVSGLEDEVAEVLIGCGVEHERQVAVRGAGGRFVGVVDFALADGRVLEVNGTFWHADPRVFPDGPVHASQRRTAERWDRKVAALANLGIPLVVLWEADFREDPAQAVAVALA